jgi:hypothetical protein
VARAAGAEIIPFESLRNAQHPSRFPPSPPPPVSPSSASPSSPYPISPSTSAPSQPPSSTPPLPARQLTLNAPDMPAPVEKKQARKRKPKGDPSRHKQTVDLFVRLWAEIRGGTYHVIGGRDGLAVKRMLVYPEATDAEIERRMRRALADPFFQRAGNLAFFASRWSTYDRDAAPPVRQQAVAQGSSRRIVGINTDGSMKYAE